MVWNNFCTYQGFSRCFRDPIRVPRIREHYHWFPRIRAIGSLQVHTRFLTFSFKKVHLYIWLFAGNTSYYHVIFYNRSCTFVMCTPGPYLRTDDQFRSIWTQTKNLPQFYNESHLLNLSNSNWQKCALAFIYFQLLSKNLKGTNKLSSEGQHHRIARLSVK